MKQVLLSKGTGAIRVAEVPPPSGAAHGVLVRTRCSVISSGTERAALATSGQSLLSRVRERPELARRAWALVRDRGLVEAYRSIHARLTEETALGYSLAGEVLDGRAAGLEAGTRVAAVGGGAATHAEIVEVPPSLVIPLPEGVTFEAAAFTAFGAIAMHGTRLAGVSLGDEVAVLGCGLVGALTIQLLKAAGCVVHAYDPSDARARLASTVGADTCHSSAEAIERAVFDRTRGRGVDAVLITAATSSSDPAHLAARLARDRGSVVVVGDVGLDLARDLFFAKELSFRVSRSYGPGRYDPYFEALGLDYPAGYVPWTERRNCEEFLRLLAGGQVRTDPLVLARKGIEAATEAYGLLAQTASAVAVVLTYPGAAERRPAPSALRPTAPARERRDVVRLGVIGGGEFARATLLPLLRRRRDVDLVAIAAASPVSAARVGTAFGFRRATTAAEEVWAADDIDAVVIATRHDSHAALAAAGLAAGKAVFVEKPLAIDADGLEQVARAFTAQSLLQVGFNRPFSPLGRRLRDFLGDGPGTRIYRVNAGHVPANHWTRQREVGGGRIIGEACHFLDFLNFLCDRQPVGWHAVRHPVEPAAPADGVTVVLDYGAAGTATLVYVTAPSSGMTKERVEALGTGRAGVLRDFRSLELWSGGRAQRFGGRRVQKGFPEELEAFVAAVAGRGPPPQRFEDLRAVTALTFDIAAALGG